MSQRVAVALNTDDRLIILHAQQGRIDHLSLRAPNPPLELMTATRFERWAALLLPAPLRSPIDAEIEVKGDGMSGLIATAHPIPTNLAPPRPDDPLSPADIAHCAVFIENHSVLAAPEQSSRIASAYFQDLDEESNPFLFPYRAIRADAHSRPDSVTPTDDLARRASLIGRTVPFLWDRIWARICRRSPSPICPSSEEIALLSALQLAPFLRHFKDNPADGIMDAYARFACGELRLNVHAKEKEIRDAFSNGCPNGANVFCFAEFAFVAIELGIDAAEWLCIAPALVATQELFLYAFGSIDEQSGRPIRQPKESYGDRPRRAVDESLRASIIDRHRGLNTLEALRDQAMQHAKDAFNDVNPILVIRPHPSDLPRKPQTSHDPDTTNT